MELLQNASTKVDAATLKPVEYPDNPDMEWCGARGPSWALALPGTRGLVAGLLRARHRTRLGSGAGWQARHASPLPFCLLMGLRSLCNAWQRGDVIDTPGKHGRGVTLSTLLGCMAER